MPQTINTNVMSLNAQRNLNASQGSLAVSLQRLSSGLRINSAKDDAAGMAITERFTAQIRGLDQAARNANDGISLAQTAEGALVEVGNNLQRIRELAVQASNATNSQSDRDALQLEVAQALSEIDRVANQTQFNGVKLLDGSFTGAQFQVGANAGETIALSSISDANIAVLGSVSQATGAALSVAASGLTGFGNAVAAGGFTVNGISVGAITAASSAAERAGQMVNAINGVSQQTGVGASYDSATGQISLHSAAAITIAGAGAVAARANLGALQNRFTSVVASLTATSENLSASRGRIQDADFAKETANLTRAQILQQAGTAMLAQANAAPQNVLSLLRG
ncbi:MAG: flagellin/flagellar hook associated protein [Panacagrimonas sp.]|nr:flagellin [Panacagrimonas sp.]MCC2658576.1 flagellin/flagellar hook associated protein [Panacagrimonas sp.]